MRFVLSLAVLFAVATPAAPQSATAQTIAAHEIEVVFSVIEKRIINDFFGKKATAQVGGKKSKQKGGKSGNLPPGLAAKETLPPGLERQLERRGTLPPGLAKRDLPPDLKAGLPNARPGHRRVIVGSDVLLIELATGIILDIIRDVVRN